MKRVYEEAHWATNYRSLFIAIEVEKMEWKYLIKEQHRQHTCKVYKRKRSSRSAIKILNSESRMFWGTAEKRRQEKERMGKEWYIKTYFELLVRKDCRKTKAEWNKS